jgi:peptidoglycan LD-endopeptidase LytH
MCRSRQWMLVFVHWMCWEVYRSPTISVLVSADHADHGAVQDGNLNTFAIPSAFDAPFGSYPNMLNISEMDRKGFHSVIVYPQQLQRQYQHLHAILLPVMDCRTVKGMATVEQIERAKRRKFLRICSRWTQRIAFRLWNAFKLTSDHSYYQRSFSIGKYDENRIHMYDTDLFDNLDHTIDGYSGRRTVHIGVDLSAPVGTPVHSFANGVVHSVGYNPDPGDYGYVIVIEHNISPCQSSCSSNTTKPQRVWALYGHLDQSTVKRKRSCRPGLAVTKGQVIGRVGDVFENGGWNAPHVHFQLSMNPPDQPHDMPGASSVEDRPKALLQYPDPRYVLGPIY